MFLEFLLAGVVEKQAENFYIGCTHLSFCVWQMTLFLLPRVRHQIPRGREICSWNVAETHSIKSGDATFPI